MKLPNLRLHETQAVASAWIGVLAMLCIAALTVFVFKGFNMEEKVIPYNAAEGYGRFRRYLVFGTTGLAFLVGLAAGMLGFISLGQKRNTKQGHSWFGLATGALSMSAAPVLLAAWKLFSETVILE